MWRAFGAVCSYYDDMLTWTWSVLYDGRLNSTSGGKVNSEKCTFRKWKINTFITENNCHYILRSFDKTAKTFVQNQTIDQAYFHQRWELTSSWISWMSFGSPASSGQPQILPRSVLKHHLHHTWIPKTRTWNRIVLSSHSVSEIWLHRDLFPTLY